LAASSPLFFLKLVPAPVTFTSDIETACRDRTKLLFLFLNQNFITVFQKVGDTNVVSRKNSMPEIRWQRYARIGNVDVARAWVALQANLGLAANTLDAYARALEEYLAFSAASETPLYYCYQGSHRGVCPQPEFTARSAQS
jgi:hypothetical protein